MDRQSMLKLWDESWASGIWISPWSKAVEDLSPEQACWRPAPGRHCIWEMVTHVCIWRESTLSRLDGRPGPSPKDLQGFNFECPASPTADAWRKTIERLRRTHDDVRAAIADPASSLERLQYHLGHDCYHLGQVMYLRALQGMAPIE